MPATPHTERAEGAAAADARVTLRDHPAASVGAVGGGAMMRKVWSPSTGKNLWCANEPYFTKKMKRVVVWVQKHLITDTVPQTLRYDADGLCVKKFFFSIASMAL